MSKGGSDEHWGHIAEALEAEEGMADLRVVLEEEINDLRVGLSHDASHLNNRERDVVISRALRRETVLRDGAREDGCSTSAEANVRPPAGPLENVVLGGDVEGGMLRTSGKNEQSSPESHYPHYYKAAQSIWSGRQGQRQTQPSLHSPHSESAQSSSGGWRDYRGDHSGPRGLHQRREPPFHLDLNEPAPLGDVDPFRQPLYFAPADEQFLADDRHQADVEIHSSPFVSADRLRLFVSRASAASLAGSDTPSSVFLEGVDSRPHMQEVPAVESPDIGGSAEPDGEADGERLINRQRTLRSMLWAPEKIHHKRAKFFSVPTRYPFSASSRGSPSSSSSLPGSPSRSERGSQRPPPTSSLTRTAPGDERDPMEFDGAGGQDGDDGDQSITVAELEDGVIRMDLTDDLLHKVFSFLDDVTLCQAAMVCRQWRLASAHEDFWKVLNFEGRHVSHEQVGLLCVRYPKATTLNLKGAPCVDEVLVREAMRSLRNLEVLSLGRGFLSDGFFYALGLECPSLQNLSISDAVLGSGGAQEIQLRHDSLRRLHIYKCRVLRIAIRCPQLDSLCLKRTGTASAMLHCPRLVSLDVSSCHKLSDAGVRAAATACPLLASLDMSNCTYVSDETLREISIACTNLRTLDASYCPNISLEGVRMPMLVELKLQGCEGIISSSMAALSNCSMLEDLAMDFCWLLTAVTLDLPRLRQISLTNNRKFVELTLRCPALTKLSLTHCPILSKVDISSSSLQSLVLRQQNGLSTMALQCTWLHEVDLTECEALTNAVCDVFSDGGGCPKLRSLILDSCEGLTDVKLASSSIQTLSLVGCRNIESINLSCPVLQHLHLDGCDHLTGAAFAPVGLQSLNLGICPHLVKLEVEASRMTTLDLRGCGVLSQASICCPSLMSLDASYCSLLGDDCLAQTTAACPSIQSLVLACCPSVGPVGLLSLKKLPDLTMLDLSYTYLTDLSPIFEACPGLKVLRLSACKYLGDTALDALHGGKVLPELHELDLSYGSLGHSAIEGVMALCPHLCHVSLNGLAHVTDLLWARLSSPPLTPALPEEASSIIDTQMDDAVLSDIVGTCEVVEGEQQPMDVVGPRDGGCGHAKLVAVHSSVALPTGCSTSNSGTTFPEAGELLGSELPMDAELGPVRALQNLSCVGCPHIKKVVIPRFAACLHLSSLNLSLSVNIREVQLSCTNLTSLNLSNCAGLVVLELECPRLVSLLLQACGGIEAEMLELAIQGCGLLETLDVRSCSKVSPAALARMRAVCPGLKRLYSTMST